MRKLAFDLGTKTCGFAITDENEIIALTLDNFFYTEGNFNQILEKVQLYLNDYNIDGFVLGYPLKISGQKSERTLMVEQFKKKLSNFFPEIPILLINEQYSTKKAHEIMLSAGLNKKKRKSFKDKLAAQIILQDYLDYYKDKWGK
ncbi:Holliday junction resolvase RuvX [Mycoplasmopsis cricetuli]|uniref:Holliday junction resolvase RuvX n=1 Tax=Mycoplasmopsis cricetuli TaxID=171283 RepID=UPI00047202B5|nr:Holliday junction resolvase RuvX [Mycoplasmopsis cricetuli]